MMKIVVTVSDCVQVGMNTFRDINTSRVFNADAKIEDVLHWAKVILKREYVGICDLQFSSCDEDSV